MKYESLYTLKNTCNSCLFKWSFDDRFLNKFIHRHWSKDGAQKTEIEFAMKGSNGSRADFRDRQPSAIFCRSRCTLEWLVYVINCSFITLRIICGRCEAANHQVHARVIWLGVRTSRHPLVSLTAAPWDAASVWAVTAPHHTATFLHFYSFDTTKGFIHSYLSSSIWSRRRSLRESWTRFLSRSVSSGASWVSVTISRY